ncbi:hypothetical protein DRN41_00935 [Thermococci archaeon]|nr:MAG: hypothetical protein DRN41_00935 [Thermococci archaeon]
MKRWGFLLGLLLLLSTIPAKASLPWITVFEGRVQIGEILIVGNYQIEITQEKYSLKPYALIRKEGKIRKLVELNGIVEVGSIRIIRGSFDDSGLFIVIQYKPTFINELKPQEGDLFNIEGYVIKVLEVDKALSLSVNGVEVYVKENSPRTYDRLVFVYNAGVLRVYSANISVQYDNSKDYELYYPFKSLRTKSGVELTIPIIITNNGNDDITLPLNIISAPAEWRIKFLGESSNYEVNEITLPPRDSVTLFLHINTPEGAKGPNNITFSVGDKIGEITVDIIDKEEIEIITPLLGIEVEAGSLISLPVYFIGPETKKVVFLEITEKPLNWDVYFTLNGLRITSFLLNSNKEVNLIVKIPQNIELGTYPIKFTANEIEKLITVSIYKTHRGEPAKLHLSVIDENGNPIPKTKVQIGNETYITNIDGSLEREMPKGNYNITVSKEGYESHQATLNLEDGEERDVTITLKKLLHYAKIELESDHLTTGFDFQPSYKIQLENLGKEDDEYFLSLEGLPSEWAIRFLKDIQSNLEVKSLKVSSESSQIIYLKIIPPLNAKPGVYNATLRVKASSGEEIAKNIQIEVIGRYEASLETSNYLLSLKPGEEREVKLTLRNFGNAITNVNIEVNTPNGWEVEVEPQKLAKVESNSAKPVILHIKVSETTPAGEYKVSIKAKADQTESETRLTVRVRQNSNYAYLGLTLLFATLIGLMLIIRRIGRR